MYVRIYVCICVSMCVCMYMYVCNKKITIRIEQLSVVCKKINISVHTSHRTFCKTIK